VQSQPQTAFSHLNDLPEISSSVHPSNQTPIILNKPENNDLQGLDLPNQYHPYFDVDHDRGPQPIEPITPVEAAWRHSGWRHQRLKVWESMQRLALPNHRLLKFANCGTNCYVEILNSQSPNPGQESDARLRSDTCHDRFCIPCAQARGFAIATALAARMADTTTRFVTFTLRCNQRPLLERLDRLYTCFNLLRRREFWKTHVTGGAAFCEVKLGKTPGNWHVHLHCIVSGGWVEQSKLADEWFAVTGDSYVVDIQAIPDAAVRARYVAGYVSKPSSKDVYEIPAALDEMVLALRGRRLCFTFGTWRGTPLQPIAPSQVGWTLLCRLDALADRRRPLTPLQILALRILSTRYPARFLTNDLPPPPCDDDNCPI